MPAEHGQAHSPATGSKARTQSLFKMAENMSANLAGRVQNDPQEQSAWLIQFFFRKWAVSGLMLPNTQRAEYGTLSFGITATDSHFIHLASRTHPQRMMHFFRIPARWHSN
jgi:hypothetical protein